MLEKVSMVNWYAILITYLDYKEIYSWIINIKKICMQNKSGDYRTPLRRK